MEYIVYISLFFSTLFSIFSDYKRHDTFVTPYVIFVFPNFIILTLCLFVGPFFGFINVSHYLLFMTFVFSFVFFIVQKVVYNPLVIKNIIILKDFYSPFIEFISVLMVLFVLLRFLLLIKGHGFYYMLTEDFTLKYARGISGHCLIVLQFIGGYHLAKFKKKHNFIIFVFILVLNFLTGVFHWIAFATVSAFIYACATKSIQLSIRKILIIAFFSILLFVGSYGVTIIINTLQSGRKLSSDTFNEI